jgi:hypothetical protein
MLVAITTSPHVLTGSYESTPVILLTGWGQCLLAEQGLPPDVGQVLSKSPKLRDLREALSL